MPELVPDPVSTAPAATLEARVAGQLQAFAAACGPRRRLLVGVSGGVDSLLLLELLLALQRVVPGLPPLSVVHVHHGLNPQADAWAERVATHCATRGVPCVVRRVQVDRRAPSLEAAARSARFAAFAQELQPGDALLLAQHADDQAETLLLRLLRGSGISGLAAMRAMRHWPGSDDVFLWRPLLAVPRDAVVVEAQRRGLVWIDDDSNADTAHDRNFLRHEILPRLATRWPALVRTLGRTARQLAAADLVLNEYLDGDLAPLLASDARWGGHPTLDAAGLLAHAPARRSALLRRWLARIGAPLFSEAWLGELLRLAAARADAEGLLQVGGWEVHRFRGRLAAFPLLPPPAVVGMRHWDGRGRLDLGPGQGALLAVAPGTPGSLALRLPAGAALGVQFRRGGERLAVAGGHHRPLKKLLQELDVPPWLRARLPLLYVDGELAAAGDFFVAGPYAPDPERPADHALIWQRPR